MNLQIKSLLFLLSLVLSCRAIAEFPVPAPVGLDPDYLVDNKGALGQVAPGQYACVDVDAPTPKRGAIRLGSVISHFCAGSISKHWIWNTPSLERLKNSSYTGGYWVVCCIEAGTGSRTIHETR